MLAVLIACEQAVYHEVGIAAYGAGEVGVVVESQSVVANVVGSIFGFHHGAQGNSLNEFLFALSFHVGHERVEAFADSAPRASRFQFVAKAHDELAQILQFGGVGLVVNAVGQGL